MTELETQIAKIQFGSPKATTSHVFVMAEQAFNGSSELYIITELPLLNPAAVEECDRISNALASSLRRSYRKNPTEQSFENALANINEELGKLVGQGKTHWIGKLNALIAVKDGLRLSITTTGKISGLLFRDDEFSAITETAPAGGLLKTFENFSIGKLHLGDILIFSTTQLFNNISIDRIKNILNTHTLPLAGQEILRILQDNVGPEIAFGSIMALMVEPGTTTVEQVALEDYIAPAKVHKQYAMQTWHAAILTFQKIWHSTQTFTAKTKSRLMNRDTGDIKNILMKNKDILSAVSNQARHNLTLNNFNSLSKQKKFFFISALILLLILGVNIIFAQRYRSSQNNKEQTQSVLSSIQKLIDDSNAALLYGDENQSRTLFVDAAQKIAEIKKPSKDQQTQIGDFQKQLGELETKLEKKVTIEANNIASLSVSTNLINLPQYIATKTGESIVSFDRNTNKVEDNVLIANQNILASQYIKGNQAVIYNGERLFLWNFGNSTTGTGFDTSVPAEQNWAGLQLYPTNNRVYLIDKNTKQVISFAVSDRDITKPVISVNAEELSGAVDMTLDGNIFVLTNQNVLKYQSGKPVSFEFPNLATKLSGSGAIYTDSNTTNLYILDSGNKRIIVTDKRGSLIQTIYSPQLTNPIDFIVDEKNKIILVLNDTSLLKLSY